MAQPTTHSPSSHSLCIAPSTCAYNLLYAPLNAMPLSASCMPCISAETCVALTFRRQPPAWNKNLHTTFPTLTHQMYRDNGQKPDQRWTNCGMTSHWNMSCLKRLRAAQGSILSYGPPALWSYGPPSASTAHQVLLCCSAIGR